MEKEQLLERCFKIAQQPLRLHLGAIILFSPPRSGVFPGGALKRGRSPHPLNRCAPRGEGSFLSCTQCAQKTAGAFQRALPAYVLSEWVSGETLSCARKSSPCILPNPPCRTAVFWEIPHSYVNSKPCFDLAFLKTAANFRRSDFKGFRSRSPCLTGRMRICGKA